MEAVSEETIGLIVQTDPIDILVQFHAAGLSVYDLWCNRGKHIAQRRTGLDLDNRRYLGQLNVGTDFDLQVDSVS